MKSLLAFTSAIVMLFGVDKLISADIRISNKLSINTFSLFQDKTTYSNNVFAPTCRCYFAIITKFAAKKQYAIISS